MEESHAIPWGRLAGAGLAIVVLTLAGVIWLGLSQELLRTEMATLTQTVREMPAAPAPSPPVDPTAELKATREALVKLTAKVDALASSEDAKAIARLAVEIKTLANRVEALTTAKAAPPRETKPAPAQTQTPHRTPPAEEEVAPRPFFGPGYPNWGY